MRVKIFSVGNFDKYINITKNYHCMRMHDDVYSVHVLYLNFALGILLKRKSSHNLFVITFAFLNTWSYKYPVKEVLECVKSKV